MNIHEVWQSLFINLNDSLDENSTEFKLALAEKNIEKEIIEIPYYVSMGEFVFGVKANEEILHHYCFIDKNIYNSISNILSPYCSKKDIDDLSSILKRGYYKCIVAKINVDIQKQKEGFEKEFLKFCRFLTKENISSFKLQTNLKDESFKSENPILIWLIKTLLCNSLINEDESKEYIEELESKDSWGLFDVSDIYIDETAIDLLVTIGFKGILKEDNLNDIFNGTYTDKQLKLVFDLLEAGQLINLNDEINSPEKDYIRSRLKRLNKKLKKDSPFDIEWTTTEE